MRLTLSNQNFYRKGMPHMNVSTEVKRKEAIARMRLLHVFPKTIRQFEQEGKISRSEPPFGAFYWLEGDDLSRVRSFEEEHDALVYLVIRSHMEFGTMDCYLFVSDHPEEWEMDHEAMNNPDNGLFAYVYNHDAPDCSEFGDIGVVRTAAAGLLRTW